MILIGVCGGRDYEDYETVKRELDVFFEFTRGDMAVVHGCARGADSLAERYALESGCNLVRVPAIWDKQGRRAGIVRNGVIAMLPLYVLLAFPGGTGTADMVARAKKQRIDVKEIAK